MYSRKILSSALSLALAGVMVVPAFAATYSTAPQDASEADTEYGSYAAQQYSQEDALNISAEVNYNAPRYSVSLPTSLVFALDPYETKGNGQINSPNFFAVNYSNVPVRIDGKIWMTSKDAARPLVIKTSADEVNGATSESTYDAANKKNEIFAQVAVIDTAAIVWEGATLAGTTDIVDTKSGDKFAAVSGIMENATYTKDLAEANKTGSTKKYVYANNDARTTITGTSSGDGSLFGIYLAKGRTASTVTNYEGLMSQLNKKSASAFRFMGSLNPSAKWESATAGEAVVDFGTAFTLTGLSSEVEKTMVARLITGTSYFKDGSGPALISSEATVKLNTAAEGAEANGKAGTLKVYLGEDSDNENASKAATGITKIVIKDFPTSAETTVKDLADREITADQYTLDTETGELTIDIGNVPYYISRTTKLIAAKTGYKLVITMDDEAATELEGTIKFVNK